VKNARAARAGVEPDEVPTPADPPEEEWEEEDPTVPDQPELPGPDDELEEEREQNSENGNYTGEGEEDSQDEPEDLVTIIVDGEERQVPRDQVYEQGIRTLQKEAAADKRLAEATQRMREVEAYRQSVEAQLRNSQRKENDGRPLSKQQDADVRKRARQIIDKILDGNEDEAAEALAEAMTGRQQSTPDFDEQRLAQELTEKVQRNLERQAGIAAFNEQYAHIANDPQLFAMADRKTIEIAQEHPEWGPKQIILEAGKKVEEWLAEVGGGPTSQNDTPPPSRKNERKRTTEKLKTAKSAKAPRPAEKRPQTKSEIVADMRKRRGLPNY